MIYTRGSVKRFFRGDSTLKGVWGFAGNTRDESGYNHHATIRAQVAYRALTGLSSVGVVSLGLGVPPLPYPEISVSPATVLGTIGTGDFTVMLRIYPVQPAAGVYTQLFQSTAFASGLSIWYDPLNTLGYGDGIVFRIAANIQAVTAPPASAFYNRWLLITFLRNNGNCRVYYNNELKLSFADVTSIIIPASFALFSQDTGGGITGWMEAGGQGKEFACWRRALSPQEIYAYCRCAGFS